MRRISEAVRKDDLERQANPVITVTGREIKRLEGSLNKAGESPEPSNSGSINQAVLGALKQGHAVEFSPYPTSPSTKDRLTVHAVGFEGETRRHQVRGLLQLMFPVDDLSSNETHEQRGRAVYRLTHNKIILLVPQPEPVKAENPVIQQK